MRAFIEIRKFSKQAKLVRMKLQLKKLSQRKPFQSSIMLTLNRDRLSKMIVLSVLKKHLCV